MGGIKWEERRKGKMEGEGGMKRDDSGRSAQEAGRREGGRAGRQVPADDGHLKPMELHRRPLLISLGHVEIGCPPPPQPVQDINEKHL